MGLAARDIIFSIDRLPAGPGKSHATERTEVGGGPAANAAATVASLGGSARFIGPVGDDLIGRQLIQELASCEVDVTRVRRVPGRRSPLSAVMVDASGERAIVNHTDDSLFEQADPIEAGDLEAVDAVLADVRWLDGAVAALQWARSHQIPGVVDLDVGFRSPEVLLEPASHVVFSATALRSVAEEDKLETALSSMSKRTDAWLAVTDGANGAYWMEGEAVSHTPAHRIEVVDTTGAGDVFHGAFALALAEGSAETAALEIASAAAAISCTRFGGRTGLPRRDELETFLEERR